MLAAPKRRGAGVLQLLLMLAVLPDAHSASPGLHKGLAPSSGMGEAAAGHASRPLSRGEIFQAIRDDLARKGMGDPGDLRPEDLKVQFAAPVSSKDAGLEVKKIGFDLIRRETIFELWTSKQPQLLPFQVATRWAPPQVNSAVKPESRTRESAQAGRGLDPTRLRPPVLAKPGRSATLVMLGHNLRITTSVMPLQPGSKGQCILVRDTATERVMRAEVVAEGLLRTSF
jgi:hypothetical protein